MDSNAFYGISFTFLLLFFFFGRVQGDYWSLLGPTYFKLHYQALLYLLMKGPTCEVLS